jgi:RHS repeat-associated protein
MCVFGVDYRYGFNGMQRDDELKGEGNSLDFGARIYDSRLGKFLSLDPLTYNFPFYSPYQFANNNPVAFIDINGEQGVSFIAFYIRKQLDNSPFIKLPKFMDIIEHNNGRSFNSAHLNAVNSYTKKNWSLGHTNSTYGYGPENHHDCITSFNFALRSIYSVNDTKKFNFAYVESANGRIGAYNSLKQQGYVGNEKTVDMKTPAGTNATNQDPTVSNLSSSISQFGSATTAPNVVGFYGISLMGGFHTMMMVVDKRGGSTSYRLLDQHDKTGALDRTKDLTAEQVDQYFIDFANANSDARAARTVKAFELIRKEPQPSQSP